MSRLESEPRRFPIHEAKTITSPSKPLEISRVEAQAPVIGRAFSLEQREQAISSFESEEKPLSVLLQNADLLKQAGEHRLASNLYIAILRRDSAHEEAIRSLGECYFKMHEWTKAEKILKISADISPLTSTLLFYAETLYQVGRTDEALALYNELLLDLSDEEDLFRVYKAVGNIYVKQRDFDSAEENYNKAFSIHPDSDVLLVNYGTLEIQRGDIQQALDKYREALEINPENEKAWVGIALIHREYGDFELAWGNLHKALDLDPLNKTALQLMADWAVKDHRLHEALQRFERYLSLKDQDAEISFLLAKLYFICGQTVMAEMEATRAQSLDPGLEGMEEFLQALRRPAHSSEARS